VAESLICQKVMPKTGALLHVLRGAPQRGLGVDI